MRNYRIILVVKTGSEEARKKILETVKGLLKNAKVSKEEDLGSKALAYKIKSELSGHYYELTIEAETMPADFEKRLVEVDGVLRHLVLVK